MNSLLVEGVEEAMTARWEFVEKIPEGKVFFKDFDEASDGFQKLAFHSQLLPN